MNLVAREFVAARDDEHGVIVLCCFAGASREFNDAVIVNPYAIDDSRSMLIPISLVRAKPRATHTRGHEFPSQEPGRPPRNRSMPTGPKNTSWTSGRSKPSEP
jgi:hypothetical protein